MEKTLWYDAIFKEMMELDNLGVFQFYLPKNKFKKKDGRQYAPILMVFDVKQKDLRHKSRLVVGGHVMDSKDYTTYSYNIKFLSVRQFY